jgi:hypothetical protein
MAPGDDPLRELFRAAEEFALAVYGRRPRSIRLDLEGADRPLHLPMPPPTPQPRQAAPAPPAPPAPQPRGVKHSPDFRCVNWYGQIYSLTPAQAAVVRILWDAWENETPDVGQESLLESSGSESAKLSDVFKDSPAWNTLVVSGGSRGTFRLANLPGG